MSSHPDVREVWEDVIRQTSTTLHVLCHRCLPAILGLVTVYTVFVLGCMLLYLDKNGIMPKSLNSKPETRVIILTYMRSGSTFTAELFQAHSDVFFMFEPLHTVWYYKPNVYVYLNRPPRMYHDGQFWEFTEQMKSQTLSSTLSCSFLNVDVMTLLQHHWINSRTTLNYKLCTSRIPGVVGLEHCVSLLSSACSKAKVTLVKTINFTMNNVEPFLKSDTDLKLIHLVRDPRATIWSHLKFKAFLPNQLAAYSRHFCNMVLTNVQGYIILNKLYPERVAFVRYEDIAQDPITYTNRLYNFVGLSISDVIENYVRSITFGVKAQNCSLCINKANSSKAAELWRHEVGYDYVKTVDAHCGHLYPHLGYRPLASVVMLKNTRIPLRQKPIHIKLL